MDDDSTTHAAEAACARLMTGCYTLMDLGRYDAVARLFTDDGVWVRGGVPVEGRQAIRAALEKRPEGVASRHLISNIVVTIVGDGEAEAVGYFLPLRAQVDADGVGVLPPFTMVGDLEAQFRREDGAWRVTLLRPRPVFKAEA